jgi:hypothetical protein
VKMMIESDLKLAERNCSEREQDESQVTGKK